MTQTQTMPRSNEDTIQMLKASRVVPVVTLHDASHAVPIARALLAGGIHAIEITLRTDAAYDGIKAVKAEVPEIALGVGTVFHTNQVEFCREVGVDFLVTPGTTPQLFAAVEGVNADGHPLLLIPGVATASEVVRAMEAGYLLQKFFPAEANGGIPALKAISGPLGDVSFMPTGGVTPDSAADYLALPNVVCVGGSWITKSGDPDTITELAKTASAA